MSTAVSNSTSADPYAALRTTTTPAAKAEDTASADRFLKMLVTQLQNQDPLNPMDNAQVTSQMAQINAVTGLEKVNESVKALGGQFLQMQMLQGAALVGREVSLDGDLIGFANGKGRGAFELQGPASDVKVEVLDASGAVVDTLALGGSQGGRLSFEWNPGAQPTDRPYGFRVLATNAGQAVAARTLSIDRVQSISTAGNVLTLTLDRLGQVPASQVVAFN
ncbi:MAG: flagellar hook assembly protein FlgD [Rubrivivax sp.]|nr:flagellar hook assembly protein FlgD [Rubrivivax sp.]